MSTSKRLVMAPDGGIGDNRPPVTTTWCETELAMSRPHWTLRTNSSRGLIVRANDTPAATPWATGAAALVRSMLMLTVPGFRFDGVSASASSTASASVDSAAGPRRPAAVGSPRRRAVRSATDLRGRRSARGEPGGRAPRWPPSSPSIKVTSQGPRSGSNGEGSSRAMSSRSWLRSPGLPNAIVRRCLAALKSGFSTHPGRT